MPIPIQVVFQGGGARIAALLAAVQAIQELEAEGTIIVTRVAGASAGAIAAGVLAAKVPAGVLRKELQRLGDALLSKTFPKPSLPKAVARIAAEKPLYDIDRLTGLIIQLFAAARMNNHGVDRSTRICDLPKPLFLTVTSLNTQKSLHRTGTDFLIESMVDSSALPIVFRMHKELAANATMDGGLCENLPVDSLIEGVAEHGNIVAMSFGRGAPALPTSFTETCISSLDMAISNSVERAKATLGPDAVCEVPTALTLLDFDRICRDGLDDAPYERARLHTRHWLENYASAPQAPRVSVASMLNGIGLVYETLQKAPVTIRRSAIVVFVGALEPHPTADEVHHFHEVESAKEPLRAFRTTMSASGRRAGATFEVRRSSDSSEIEHVALPAQAYDAHSTDIALFFRSAIAARTRVSITSRESIMGGLAELRKSSRDSVFNANLRPGTTVECMDIVIGFPAKTRLHGTARLQKVGGADLGHQTTVLTDRELTKEYGPYRRAGQRLAGWRVRSAPEFTQLIVDLTVS